MPNPFRGDAPQAPLPPKTQAPLPPQSEAPNVIDSGAAEPSELSPMPARDEVQPADAPFEAEPDQPVPMSSNYFPPMADAGANTQRQLPGPAWVAQGAMAAQSQNVGGDENTQPLIGGVSPSVQASLALAAEDATPVSEREPQWRVVIHDQAGAPTSNRPDSPLFRPPSLDEAQLPAPPMRTQRPEKPTLEEETGDALRRFMSVEAQPNTIH
jgi:hypothetical protein